MEGYLLTIKIPIGALDDLEARSTAKVIIEKGHDLLSQSDLVQIKLQRLEKNKAPVGVQI